MDIFSHGLWAGLASKIFNLEKKGKEKFNFWIATFWGMFPDLFAFTIPFVVMIFSLISGNPIGKFPRVDSIEPAQQAFPTLNLAHTLYNYSHSIVIFAIVFVIALLIFRKKAFYLFGWFLHILMDIPTHTYQFFPTPFLWPISDLRVSGFSWAQPWFFIIDYATLAIMYFFVWRFEKRGKKNDG